MQEFTGLISMDRPRPRSNESGELRFNLRALKAENPQLDRLGADGRPVGLGIVWKTSTEPTVTKLARAIVRFTRHLKSTAIISGACEPYLLESKFLPLVDDPPELTFTLRW